MRNGGPSDDSICLHRGGKGSPLMRSYLSANLEGSSTHRCNCALQIHPQSVAWPNGPNTYCHNDMMFAIIMDNTSEQTMTGYVNIFRDAKETNG